MGGNLSGRLRLQRSSGRGTCFEFALQENGQAERLRGTFRKMLLHRLQITAKDLRTCGLSNAGHLEIEKQLQFPLSKGVAADRASNYLLDELIEVVQVGTL